MLQANESPEVISKAVACLPANQMFELMLQMKGCIQNNPLEARTMLAKNPQLTYALLHAQILLDIMDPKDFLVFFILFNVVVFIFICTILCRQ